MELFVHFRSSTLDRSWLALLTPSVQIAKAVTVSSAPSTQTTHASTYAQFTRMPTAPHVKTFASIVLTRNASNAGNTTLSRALDHLSSAPASMATTTLDLITHVGSVIRYVQHVLVHQQTNATRVIHFTNSMQIQVAFLKPLTKSKQTRRQLVKPMHAWATTGTCAPVTRSVATVWTCWHTNATTEISHQEMGATKHVT